MTEVFIADSVWQDVEEGTEALLQEWQVQPGDAVEAGQVLGLAELVKTTHEIVAPAAGRVGALLVAADDTFGRGQALAVLGD